MLLLVRCLGASILLQTVAVLAQPDGSSFGTCLDLTFMIDVSCSVSRDDMIRGIEFAKVVVDNLDSKMTIDRDTTLRVAVGVFVDKVHSIFYLNKYTENKAAIMDALEDAKNYLKPEAMKCKTLTHYAIDALNNEYFNVNNGDRRDRLDADYRNVAVVVTDARTSSRKWVNNGHLGRYLKDAEEAGNDIFTVLVKNNREKEPLDEALLTGNDTSKLIDIREGNDEAEAVRFASFLKFAYSCPKSDVPLVSEVCADIIFALDVSCSITSDDKDLSTYVASEVYKKVFAETRNYGVGTSFLVFDNTARVAFDKYEIMPTIDDIATKILDVNVTNDACRTRPASMFQEVSDKELDIALPDSSTPIYMVVLYDGMTSPLNERDRSIESATEFKNKPNTELLCVKLENDRGKDGSSEFNAIPSSASHLFPQDASFLNDANKDSVVQGIADLIISGLRCPS
ncbi:unnamed protein product [Owenia fusiformis]|uniref:Uncharacterized protein n=1 Tax=Owenia fusiformis TaxID=6347 RepID=A0A8J1U1X3_OWEFU|nr:unnamed protein product [Owenia fusiformis]